MSLRKLITTLLLTLIIITLTIAIPNHSARADDEPTKITIIMDEYHFTVEGHDPNAPITLKTGVLYDMTIKNTGKFAHEIWWGKDPLMVADEGRLDGYTTNLFEKVPLVLIDVTTPAPNGYEINLPGLIEIKEGPGQSFTIEFTLPDSLKGKWEVGCFQPMPKAVATAAATAANTTPVPDVPHYMVNMKADLIVQ